MSTPQFQPAIKPLLVNVNQAATMAGISRSFLYELLAANSIRSIKVGRRRLIEVSSLRTWYKSFTANEGLAAIDNGGAR
jgi:excisionase family DNA binding protein